MGAKEPVEFRERERERVSFRAGAARGGGRLGAERAEAKFIREGTESADPQAASPAAGNPLFCNRATRTGHQEGLKQRWPQRGL